MGEHSFSTTAFTAHVQPIRFWEKKVFSNGNLLCFRRLRHIASQRALRCSAYIQREQCGSICFIEFRSDPIRSVFCHSLTVVNFCWFSSHSVVVSLAWVHRSISRLIGAGICWLRFSGVCSKLLSQLSKSESLIVVGRIRNACHTDPVDFGNAALSLPTNNLSRPHGGGNITKSIYLTW